MIGPRAPPRQWQLNSRGCVCSIVEGTTKKRKKKKMKKPKGLHSFLSYSASSYSDVGRIRWGKMTLH